MGNGFGVDAVVAGTDRVIIFCSVFYFSPPLAEGVLKARNVPSFPVHPE